jgi:hypothetical protein
MLSTTVVTIILISTSSVQRILTPTLYYYKRPDGLASSLLFSSSVIDLKKHKNFFASAITSSMFGGDLNYINLSSAGGFSMKSSSRRGA